MMKRKLYIQSAFLLFVAAMLVMGQSLAASLSASPAGLVAPVAAQPDIGVNGFFSANNAQRGRTIQAAIVMDIPGGFHVNANKPLGKYVVPTTIKVDAPGGLRIGPVSYPRASMHRLKSSDERLAVYDGRAVMRFNVTVPANFQENSAELRVRVRYQSCNDEVCFPPVTRNVTLPLSVVGANESVQRTNSQYFGGRRRRG